ncbi:hypothetical protein [Butyrivibrio sp. M55]|uniref:hypothetical protein n=1 Tax=Butyrivibrio sp. M55 TaxID=1855323 RepID=UPI0008F1D701|nr:hypothetical protein [Butyrivibrio sp. M55]SFU86484.1 hypothetical protein SAMN05216540_11534 [Butyrivibrio sp. M55]
MVEFYQTVIGKRFSMSQLPELIKSVNRLADAIEKATNLSQANGKVVIASTANADRCE